MDAIEVAASDDTTPSPLLQHLRADPSAVTIPETRPQIRRKRPNLAQAAAPAAVAYGVNEKPPWLLTVLLAVQNVVTTVGGIIFVSNVLAPKLCIMPEDPAQAYLLSTTIMMAGIATLLQTVFGVRLPIVHTAGFVYMTSTLSLLSLPSGQCPADVDLFSIGPENRTEVWHFRVRRIQGSVIVVGFVQMLLGYSGFVGKALKYVTPLTVAPTMCIIGLSVFDSGVVFMSGSWTTAIATILLLTLFSQYLRKISIPFPVYTVRKGFVRVQLKIFSLFSILFSVAIMWIACAYLTSNNSLAPTDPSNTDTKSGAFRHAKAFRFPYPFQWGWPIFEMTSIMAMLPALFASIVESAGNYYVCSKMAKLTLPPTKVVSRGIGVQGISSMLASILGVSSGVSVSTENVGNIGITQVCSRNVIKYAACIMIFISPFTKLIALFVILPDPVLGAVSVLILALIVSVALSNLQFVNLNSTRNLYILGMSMFFGLALPAYVSKYGSFVNTRYEIVNNVVLTYMSSGMFIGGLIGFVLDNTIPDDDDDDDAINSYHSPPSNDEFEYSVEVKDDKHNMKVNFTNNIFATRHCELERMNRYLSPHHMRNHNQFAYTQQRT